MHRLKMILLVIVVFCLAVIVLRNMETIDVELVITTVSMPLAALIAATLLIGFLLGFFGRTLLNVRKWRKNKSTNE